MISGMANEPSPKLLVIDVMPLLYRGHFALMRKPRLTSSGFNTSALFVFRHTRKVHFHHTCVSAFGIGEDVQLADIQSFEETDVVVEHLPGLASNTHHAIHADEGVGHARVYARHAFLK